MTDNGDIEFGDTGSDVDGEVASRKVQTGGRINFPSGYLDHIGVDDNSRVLIVVEGDSLTIKKATAESLAVRAFVKGLEEYIKHIDNAK